MWNELAADVKFRMNPSVSHSLLVVISAPSGAGKTTLCEGLLAARPNLTRAITCTTRPPRAGERDGVDYFFLSAEAFLERVESGGFLEHATVYGHRYGTLKSEVLEKLHQGRDVLLTVDVQGAATIRAKSARDTDLGRALVTVFLAPPSLDELESRLRKRDQDAETTIQKRLHAARQEIAQSRHFEYVILSQSKALDLQSMLSILEAEKLRQARVALPEYG